MKKTITLLLIITMLLLFGCDMHKTPEPIDEGVNYLVTYYVDGYLYYKEYCNSKDKFIPIVPAYASEFIGWYYTLDGEQIFIDDDYCLTSDVELFAKYSDEASVKHIKYLEEAELKNLSVDITMWHALGLAKTKIFEKLVAKFNELYPYINVTIKSQGDSISLRDKVAKGIRTNEFPTLAIMYPNDASFLIKNNAINELESFVKHPLYGLSDTQYNDFVDDCINDGMLDNILYSLPFTRSTDVLYFNASLFNDYGLLAKYNLGIIENGVFKRNIDASLTNEDIEEIGEYYLSTDYYQNLTKEEKMQNYLLSYDSNNHLFITLTKQFGGEYASFTDSEYLFNTIESKNAMQWYFDRFQSGYGYLTTAAAWATSNTSDQFVKGNVLMSVASATSYSYYNQGQDFVVGVLPLPTKNGKQEAVVDSTNVFLFNSLNHDEELAGWLFLKFMTTYNEQLSYNDQATTIWTMDTTYPPILKSIINSKEYQTYLMNNNSVKAETLKITLEQMQDAYYLPMFANNSYDLYIIDRMVNQIMYESYSIEDAYSNALSKLGK